MVRGPEVGGDTKIIKKSTVKNIDMKTQSSNVRQMMKKVPVEFFGVKERSCYPDHLGGRR